MMRASSQRQRRQAGYWRDIPRQLGEVALSVNHTTVAQLRHRMALVEFWTPAPGDQVLEVGCGQGDCTAVLAYAVGKGGKVVATDIESDTYGAPVSLRDAHRFMKSSNIGKRIEFRTCANLLDLKWDFPDEYFDLVVFAHSSWYMASLKELEELFARVRPWSKRLGYAEWYPRPQNPRQVSHLVAVLAQMHITSHWPREHGRPFFNVASLITPDKARSMARDAGWAVTNEWVTDSSVGLEDGRDWEIENAKQLAEEVIASKPPSVSESALGAVAAEYALLKMLAEDAGRESLPTYVFVAE